MPGGTPGAAAGTRRSGTAGSGPGPAYAGPVTARARAAAARGPWSASGTAGTHARRASGRTCAAATTYTRSAALRERK